MVETNSFDPFPPCCRLEEVDTFFFSSVLNELEKMNQCAICQEFGEVVLPLQEISGVAQDFSFMAYAWPRLSLEERNSKCLVDPSEMEISVLGGVVKIHFDWFGRIDWFFVKNIPDFFYALRGMVERSRAAM